MNEKEIKFRSWRALRLKQRNPKNSQWTQQKVRILLQKIREIEELGYYVEVNGYAECNECYSAVPLDMAWEGEFTHDIDCKRGKLTLSAFKFAVESAESAAKSTDGYAAESAAERNRQFDFIDKHLKLKK